MKILFITSPCEDYLADSLFHGFRQLYGADVVDFPKCEIMYENAPRMIIDQVRGKGFTLYTGLLKDIPIDRFNIMERVKGGKFDLVVISNIWRQFGWFVQMRPWLNPWNTIVLDGGDTPQVYPYAGLWWRRPYFWFLPKVHRDFLYFKREWTEDTQFNHVHKVLPNGLAKKLPNPQNLRSVAFSFPIEKVRTHKLPKIKDFPLHIVDKEISEQIASSSTTYAFVSEDAYYKDLAASRFGITTKRSGWDCLRHYEIAANGAVLCFRDLHKKPLKCAPHGLNNENSISYGSARELLAIIRGISIDKLMAMEQNTFQWIQEQTTIARAKQIIEIFYEFGKETKSKGLISKWS